MNRQITIPVRLDEKTFKRFSRFDMFRLRRRWVRPVVFALILLAFAALALFSGRAQGGMIAAVLVAVGLGLPLVYFGTFLSQVNGHPVPRGRHAAGHLHAHAGGFPVRRAPAMGGRIAKNTNDSRLVGRLRGGAAGKECPRYGLKSPRGHCYAPLNRFLQSVHKLFIGKISTHLLTVLTK